MSSKKASYRYMYVAAALLALHYALTIYINSTFLGQFFDEDTRNTLYALGSIGTLIGLAASTTIIKAWGNFRWIVIGLIAEIISLYGLSTSSSPAVIAAFFIIHQMLPPLLVFSLDIFLEKAIRTENVTGRVRSTYLTIINIAFLVSPFLTSQIVARSSLQGAYLISAACTIILLFVAFDYLRHKETHLFREANIWDSLKKFSYHKGLEKAFLLNFILQCFYALMVIYMPLYLLNTIGFNLKELGLLFTIMLLPFVLFEVPLGRLFDKTHAERDALISGFLIMAISSFCIYLTDTKIFWLWALLLFFSRTGASFVEIGSEYLFFKKVDARDVGFISVFRMTGPLAYVVAPLLAAVLQHFLPMRFIFLWMGCIVLCGIPLAYALKRIKQRS